MKPWSQLTDSERANVHRDMTLCGGSSVNGVAGWHYQRMREVGGLSRKKLPQIYRPSIRNISVAPIETLTLEDVADLFELK